jgi:hypothetical protein
VISSDFDLQALHAALDAQRRQRGLTWAEASRQITTVGRAVATHPIASSTMTSLKTGRLAEADGVLQMIRWLGVAPEDFVTNCPRHLLEAAALPPAKPGEVLRFDTRKLHEAIDAERQRRRITWQQFARESGVTDSQARGLSKGGRTAFPAVMRLTAWLDRPAADFVRRSPR